MELGRAVDLAVDVALRCLPGAAWGRHPSYGRVGKRGHSARAVVVGEVGISHGLSGEALEKVVYRTRGR